MMWDFLKGEPVFLASNSPRRRKLLEDTGLVFDIQPVETDEKLDASLPVEDAVVELSRLKASTAARNIARGWIIGADTVVVLDNQVFGKPRSAAEAEKMIRSLSGRTHRVITGFTILHSPGMESISDFASTEVVFHSLSDDDIKGYIDTGEYVDKAGGYGAQGIGGLLIDGYEGCFFNVVGLPLSKLRRSWIELSQRMVKP